MGAWSIFFFRAAQIKKCNDHSYLQVRTVVQIPPSKENTVVQIPPSEENTFE
jgi:hypothetical protein